MTEKIEVKPPEIPGITGKHLPRAIKLAKQATQDELGTFIHRTLNAHPGTFDTSLANKPGEHTRNE